MEANKESERPEPHTQDPWLSVQCFSGSLGIMVIAYLQPEFLRILSCHRWELSLVMQKGIVSSPPALMGSMDWCWRWSSNTLATWCEELTHSKRPWCWERLKAGGERDDRGWDGWMASLTRWTWFQQAPGDGDGQGGLECCSPRGHSRIWLSDWTTLYAGDPCENKHMKLRSTAYSFKNVLNPAPPWRSRFHKDMNHIYFFTPVYSIPFIHVRKKY